MTSQSKPGTGQRALRFGFGHLGLGTDMTGRLALAALDEAVRQSIWLIVSTRPGERLMRPRFGCHLDRLIFEPIDNTTCGMAMHYVEQAVRRWEPRAEIVALDANPDPDLPSLLVIELTYRVRPTQTVDTATIEVAVDGRQPGREGGMVRT